MQKPGGGCSIRGDSVRCAALHCEPVGTLALRPCGLPVNPAAAEGTAARSAQSPSSRLPFAEQKGLTAEESQAQDRSPVLRINPAPLFLALSRSCMRDCGRKKTWNRDRVTAGHLIVIRAISHLTGLASLLGILKNEGPSPPPGESAAGLSAVQGAGSPRTASLTI